MGRIAGIDWGTARIGLALSDETKFLATPFKTLKTLPALPENAKMLAEMLKPFEPLDALVIGLPLKLSGAESPLSTEVRALKLELEKLLSCPIVLWDERLSTLEVERTLRESHLNRKKRAEVIDAAAAAKILQSYLDSPRQI